MRLRLALLGGLFLLFALALAAHLMRRPAVERGPIVIGLLHAAHGPMAVSEDALVAAARLAVDDINAGGGLLGRRVELRLEDSGSDPAAAARRLIDLQHAAALFGCWTTACREAVRPVVEARRHLLFYPLAYEGMEQSPHIVYTGPTPNQQILPATDWAMHGFGRRIYLIGTEGPFTDRAHALLREFITLGGGHVLGERVLPLGSGDVGAVIADLQTLQPDLVVNTLIGDSNGALFDALAAAALTDLPMLSFRAAEPEMRAYGGGRLDRNFTAWGYLRSQPGPDNEAFLRRLHDSQGTQAQASDPVVSVLVAVRLWAAAVREVGSEQVEAVNANVLQQSVSGPQGFVAVDAQTRHVWRPLRIAQVRPDGQLAEVLALPRPVKPAPWPSFRTQAYWTALVARHGGRP